jgi:hypothetical protein
MTRVHLTKINFREDKVHLFVGSMYNSVYIISLTCVPNLEVAEKCSIFKNVIKLDKACDERKTKLLVWITWN